MISNDGVIAEKIPEDAVSWEVTADIITHDGDTYQVDINGTAWQVSSKNETSADTDTFTWKAYALESHLLDRQNRVRRYPINTPDALHRELNNNAFLYLSAPMRGRGNRASKGTDIILSTATIKQVRFYQNVRIPIS